MHHEIFHQAPQVAQLTIAIRMRPFSACFILGVDWCKSPKYPMHIAKMPMEAQYWAKGGDPFVRGEPRAPSRQPGPPNCACAQPECAS